MIEEEVEALHSLFCLPGECDFQDNTVTINTQVEYSNPAKCIPVQIVLQLPADYPTNFPLISILSEHMNRDMVSRIKVKTLKCCETLSGEPMLISLIFSLQENIREELESQKCISENNVSANLTERTENIWTSVLHIDHMRSANRYCKTLEKWASELSLNGGIIFLNKLILVILQGDIDSIKNFIGRLKTVCIDVDSKGHSCKERMMSVLCEKEFLLSQINRFISFERKHVESKEELKSLFIKAGLGELHHEHVGRLQAGYV